MQLFPKPFRAPDAQVAALRTALAGHGVLLPEAQIAAALPEHTETLQEEFEGIAQAATALGGEIGPLVVSAEFILQAQHPTIIPFQENPTATLRPIVVWNHVGPLYQILDPKAGRRWITRQMLLEAVHQTTIVWDEDSYKETQHHSLQIKSIEQRLLALNIDPETVTALLTNAVDSLTEWAKLTRTLPIVQQMVDDGVQRGDEAEQLLLFLLEQGEAAWPTAYAQIPDITIQDGTVTFQGVFAVPILGCEATSESEPAEEESPTNKGTDRGQSSPDTFALMRQVLFEEGSLHPIVLLLSIILVAGSLFLEVIILRSLMEIGQSLDTPGERLNAILLVIFFLCMLFILSWRLRHVTMKAGRRIGLRLRQTAFNVVPQLSDQYFQRFSLGGLVGRIYNLQNVSKLTISGTYSATRGLRVIALIIGIAWIDWVAAITVIVFSALGLFYFQLFVALMSWVSYPVRKAEAATNGIFVDAVHGRPPIWSHGAEQAISNAYDIRLTQASRASATREAYLNASIAGNILFNVIMLGSQFIVFTIRGGSATDLFLLFYWNMEYSQLLTQALFLVREMVEGVEDANRFSEIAYAQPEKMRLPDSVQAASGSPSTAWVHMQDVVVQLGEQTILEIENLAIPKGEHVAIVGTSGAGKSTLVGLLLGRHYATEGAVYVDGQRLDYQRLQNLRQRTAWVDPNLTVWDESLLHNLRYGMEQEVSADLFQAALKQADLLSVLGQLPQGSLSTLGESGRHISGGEGQRVRFGRGLHRPSAELVILDEAFRGIDRESRSKLLNQARAYWPDATLICVTHDVSHTLSFERVLVVEQGQIIEDAHPQQLLAQPDSRYRALLDEEEAVRINLWKSETWRHLYLENGSLTETNQLQAI